MSLPPGNGLEIPADIPPLENPVSEPTPERVRRIPNLGHALLFVGFAAILFLLLQLTLLMLGMSPVKQSGGTVTVQHPMLQIALLAVTYVATLAAAWLCYPLVWRASFLDGVRWHWATARAQAPRLLALGLALGVMMQIVTYFITPPKSLPIDQFFLTARTAWLITLFGTFVAPVFEEICFRGFLLPALATAYDWLTMPRTEEGRERWKTTTMLTPDSLIFSAVLTSLLFALIHAQQVAHMGVALLALFSISLVLTFVRVKTESVAASAMVHAAYNGFIFVTAIAATGGYRHLEKMTQ
jgi:membrane protease YdiL (CAAX protease family)